MGTKKRPEAGGSGQRQKAQDVVSRGTYTTRSCENLSSQKDNIFDRIGPYTAIPNDLFEAVIYSPLSRSELKTFLSILRFTYGFHKTTDNISMSQLSQMTGLSTRMAIFAVQNLEAKRMIQVQRKRGRGYKNVINSITVNEKYESWVVKEKSRQYDNALKKRKELHKKSSAKVVKENGDGERNHNLVVKENAFSSESAFTYKRNPKQNKTTTGGVVVENSFKENPADHQKDNPAPVAGNSYGLTEEQAEFVELEVERAHMAGTIRSTKEAYKNGLIKRAKDGILDISGLAELRADAKEAAEMEEINRKAEAFGEIQEQQVASLPEENARELISGVLDGTLKIWPAEHQGETFNIDGASLSYMLETEWPELYKQVKGERAEQLRKSKQQALMEAMGDKKPYDFCLEVALADESGEYQDFKEILECEYSEEWQKAARASRLYKMMRVELDQNSKFLKRKRVDQYLKELLQNNAGELASDLCQRLRAAGVEHTRPWVY